MKSVLSCSRGRRQHGAVAIEMVLIFPIFMFVLFAIIEYGVALYNKSVMTNISREAARDAVVLRVVKKTSQAIQNEAQTKCSSLVISFGSSACSATVIQPALPTAGNAITVNLSYNYKGFFSYKSQSPIVASTQMLFE